MWEESSSDEEDVHPYFIHQRRRRVFRTRINCNFVSVYEFNERFRLSSVKLESLLQDIGHRLHRETNRSRALSEKLQLCVALHWFGNGGQYHGISDMHGISKASVCRAVHAVVNAVNEVKFPVVVNWPANIMQVVTKFHNLAQMPTVIGCIDGTLINIDAPQQNEAQFVDRHGNHSLNCMVVCGPNCSFYYVSARWPGSVHDSRVLRNSTLYQRFEEGWRPIPNAILLGDSGYPLKEWLITPTFRNFEDPAVLRFNRAHKSTRRLVENAFGILKEKFPCLKYLRLNPTFAGEVFKCCTALCNISKTDDDDQNIPRFQVEDEVEEEIEHIGEQQPAARRRLTELIDHFR